MSYWGFRPYVPVAKRRARAEKEMLKLRKKGSIVNPIVIEGRKIAKNFVEGSIFADDEQDMVQARQVIGRDLRGAIIPEYGFSPAFGTCGYARRDNGDAA